jgi:hypothetical protein
MRRLMFILLSSGLVASGIGLSVAVATDSPSAEQCEEDQACWNCDTMGNHVCGQSLTISEEAAESCEDPAVVAEFADGDVERCYLIMLDEIGNAR